MDDKRKEKKHSKRQHGPKAEKKKAADANVIIRGHQDVAAGQV